MLRQRYPNDPQRGSGYRSVSFDSRLDTVLRTASKASGLQVWSASTEIAPCYVLSTAPLNAVMGMGDGGWHEQDLESLIAHVRGHVMFVNPV